MVNRNPLIPYKPFEERTPDLQYRDLLRRIVTTGRQVETRQGVPALKIVGHELRFPLANGFPIITERDLLTAARGRPSPFSQALAEICAFLNGAQTQEELEAFGCFWWREWVSDEECARFGLPPGDLGPGSYGAAFRRFPGKDGRSFDQIATLLEQMAAHPHLRHHEVSPWIPEYLLIGKDGIRQAVVPPCHGWFHVHLYPESRELVLSHRQRSADAPVGLVFNLIHYAALAMMLGQATGYLPVEVVYWIDDAHIYVNQLANVEQLLATEPQRFPTVTLEPGITDLFAFRPHHFTVADYHPRLARRRIPTPV